MAQYKTVAGPVGLTIGQNASYSDAVRTYAEIINRESVNGWRLYCIQEIPVSKENGCLASLLGSPRTTITFNMLVFVNDNAPNTTVAGTVASSGYTASVRSSINRPAHPSSPVSDGIWICTCGRTHQKYETSCVCGVSKRDLLSAQNK